MTFELKIERKLPNGSPDDIRFEELQSFVEKRNWRQLSELTRIVGLVESE